MTERLTIAIPFHRDTDYLRRAIESVRAPTDEATQSDPSVFHPLSFIVPDVS